MVAQTVAFQVKAYEYRALMKTIAAAPPLAKHKPSPETLVMWVVNHSGKPLAPRNETAKKYAEANRLLQDVIVRHAHTPWADLAQDILNRGFSVQFDEEVHRRSTTNGAVRAQVLSRCWPSGAMPNIQRPVALEFLRPCLRRVPVDGRLFRISR